MDLSSKGYGVIMNGAAIKLDPNLLAPIYQFLQCETPDLWVEKARQPENLPVLLRDHLLCELKAAQSAMFLIRKYAVDPESADTLLAWFRPYEDFAYKKNWRYSFTERKKSGHQTN